MPTPQREPLRRLSRSERAALQHIAQSSSERVDQVRRATALLAVARTGVFIHAAREAGLGSGTTVADLVARFNRHGLAAVHIAGGRGRRPTYSASERARIVAMAQRQPDRRTDGTATWSLIDHLATEFTTSRFGTGGHQHDSARAAGCWQLVPAHTHLVSDRHGTTQAQVGRGDRRRSEHRRKKGLIDLAYHIAEQMGVPLWCQDEAGPYQAIPHPGESWQPEGHPQTQPHEYIRGGTAKLLTLFRPATGEVRAKGVARAPNVVLHPWLQNELLEILAELPEVTIDRTEVPTAADWATWLGHVPHLPLPPLRLILVWDNLAGHLSTSIVTWLFAHGVMPLYTPLSGSWLNMAESVQRIICGRALRGQHPQSAKELITWLEDTVAGWNADPTPFGWDGKRKERRLRARQRHLAGTTALLLHQSIAA